MLPLWAAVKVMIYKIYPLTCQLYAEGADMQWDLQWPSSESSQCMMFIVKYWADT